MTPRDALLTLLWLVPVAGLFIIAIVATIDYFGTRRKRS